MSTYIYITQHLFLLLFFPTFAIQSLIMQEMNSMLTFKTYNPN